MQYRKWSNYVDYGKGYPGYNWEVRIFRGGKCIAEASGPNVRGVSKTGFRDLDAVNAARALPDGPIADDVDVLGLLSDYAVGRA